MTGQEPADQSNAVHITSGLPATVWVLGRGLLVATLALLGIGLLIATKSAAGAALLLAAMLVAAPLQRLRRAQPLVRWSRRLLVLGLVALAVVSVANTDIPPGRARTGYKFADQVSAIFQRFRGNLGGNPPRSER